MGTARAEQTIDERSFDRRLQRCDIERERPWKELLGLEQNGLHAKILERAGIETFGDLADALDDGRLVEIDHVGEVTRATLAEVFGRLLEQGRERYLYGERGRPSTTGEMIEQALEMVGERRSSILRRYCLEGETLTDIGRDLELTHQRICQLKEKTLDELSTRFGEVARELVARVVERLEASGGLVCWSHLEGEFDGASPSLSEGLLACRLAGLEEVDRWGELLVVDRRLCSPEAVLDRLAEFLRNRSAPEVDVGAVHTWAAREGLDLEDRAAVWLAKRAVDLDLSDGPVRAPWWTDRGILLAAVEQTETPADVTEVRRAYEAVRQRHPSLPDFTDCVIQSNLQASDEVYNYDHGVYIHAADLPVAPETLEEAAGRVVEWLDGEPDAVGIAPLLDELQTAGVLPDEVTPHMLKTVLTGRAELETFRNTLLVAHRASFERDDLALVDRIERVLRRAEAPMTLDEITEGLAEYRYARPSIEQIIHAADFPLRWKYGEYFHRDKIPIGAPGVDALLAASLACLPDDAAPRSADRVYARLDDDVRQLLEDFQSPPRALWALADDDERFDTGCTRMIARTEDRDGSLLRPEVFRAVETLAPADYWEIYEHLYRQLGPFDAEETIRNMIQALRREGRITCENWRLYCVREGEKKSVDANRRDAEGGEGKQHGR